MITRWATWTSAGVSLGDGPKGPATGPLGAWADAPPLSKIHPRARRPHPTAKQVVQLASLVLGERRIDGLGVVLGTASGCAQPDREFERELEQKGSALGGPSLFVYTLPTAAAGEASIALGATGPVLTIGAGNASGLSALVRGLEWLKAGRCPAVLAASAELGVAHEHLALFLLEPDGGRPATGATGFGGSPDRGTPGGALELAATLAGPEAASVTSRDDRGFWASVSVGPAR